MFFIRSAVVLGLLVAILPSDPQQQAKLYQTASHTLHRAATFCDRNPGVCQQAEATWVVFKAKLAIGAQMAGDLINEQLSGQRNLESYPLEPLPARDTLRNDDRAPEWRHRVRAKFSTS